ncbi:MAG: DUF1588 domain-containing protein, partial [Myxococcales bacterium]|nr:DUF1588 domain-containing protein [Myxococcales bacterium]
MLEPRHIRRFLGAGGLGVLLAFGVGCVGSVDGGAAGETGAESARDVDRPEDIDEMLREQDPELFDIAKMFFPGQEAVPARARLSRLTRTQIDTTTETLLPMHVEGSIAATMPRDPLQTNYEYASVLTFNAANFTPLADWVTGVSSSVKSDPSSVIPCGASDAACREREARTFILRALRGISEPEQLSRFQTFFNASVGEVGFPQAVADLVDVTINSPMYLFRDEVQVDGKGFLLPAQQLQHLTYTLADAPPEALGLDSLDPGPFVSTDESFESTVEKMLASPEVRQKLMRFFVAWLEVKEAEDLVIGAEMPEFTTEVATAVVDETRRFLEKQLAGATPVLKDITEVNRVFASDETGFLYGVSNPPTDTMVELSDSERSGIFTHPGFIVSHSPTTRSLVKRGVFFTRKVMCLPLGSPPEDAPTSTPSGEGKTERQIVQEVTSPARCASCHAFINPFGFMLENFDGVGRWRSEHEGLPIDSSVDASFLAEGRVQENNGVDALKRFTQSMQFQQCFVRQLFRFYMGRNEEAGDDPLLRQLFFNFALDKKQDILDVLRTLATS